MSTALTTDGYLFVSGFYVEDAVMIKAQALDLGLKLYSEKEKDKWCCLVFEKLA